MKANISKKRLKSIFALLMAMLLVFGCFPVSTFAVEEKSDLLIYEDEYFTIPLQSHVEQYVKFIPSKTNQYTIRFIDGYASNGVTLCDESKNVISDRYMEDPFEVTEISYNLEGGKTYYFRFDPNQHQSVRGCNQEM